MSTTAETFTLPQNPEQALTETMRHIETLQNIYVRETEALQEARTNDFIALQDEKLKAALIYQASVKQIIRRKDEMTGVNPALKTKLHEMQEKFSAISKSNLEEINRMQRTVVRLGETIRRAAKDTARRMRNLSYGAGGTIEGEDKRAISMGVNQTA